MILIAGLGNPGDKYKNNRHNAGFMLADFLLKNSGSGDFTFEKKFGAEAAKAGIGEEEYLFLKPQNYMNRSGEAVRKAMAFYKIPLDRVYVAHDDLDIPFGKFKIQTGTGPKLHNGITSIEGALGTADFNRIRIGVENRGGESVPGEAYVLQDFTADEAAGLDEVFTAIKNRLSL